LTDLEADTDLTGRADLHMHTTASDGFATVQQVLDYIARRGTLDVIAITDHDTLDASLWAYDHRDRYPFDVIPGLEVSSAGGHVLALWVTQPIPRGLSLEETVSAIHEQDGVAVLAHPYEVMVGWRAVWRYLRDPQILAQSGLDALEVHNASTPTPGNNWLARRVAQRLGMTMTGGSDAHTLGGIGCGITRFAGHTAADLRRAILTGQTAAEGFAWPIRDYLRILPACTGRKVVSVAAARPRRVRFSGS
jgi:predicted metal-dependent phosphoesterase TrpH